MGEIAACAPAASWLELGNESVGWPGSAGNHAKPQRGRAAFQGGALHACLASPYDVVCRQEQRPRVMTRVAFGGADFGALPAAVNSGSF